MFSHYDIELIVIEVNQKKENIGKIITRKLNTSSKYIMKVQLKYEKVPLNKLNEEKVFIKNKFLVFALGKLNFSTYDFEQQTLL